MRVPELPPSMTSTYSGPRCLQNSTVVRSVKACSTQASVSELLTNAEEGCGRKKQHGMTSRWIFQEARALVKFRTRSCGWILVPKCVLHSKGRHHDSKDGNENQAL